MARGADALIVVRGERGFDGRKINFAHELADVLSLAGACCAARDAPRLADRLRQGFGQIQRGKFRLPQQHELFAQLLCGERGALARALARAVVGRQYHGVIAQGRGLRLLQ